MTHYTKKPVTVEAFQFTKEKDKWPIWFLDAIKVGFVYTHQEADGFHCTIRGGSRVKIGDYIVKDLGELRSYTPEIFDRAFDIVK